MSELYKKLELNRVHERNVRKEYQRDGEKGRGGGAEKEKGIK